MKAVAACIAVCASIAVLSEPAFAQARGGGAGFRGAAFYGPAFRGQAFYGAVVRTIPYWTGGTVFPPGLAYYSYLTRPVERREAAPREPDPPAQPVWRRVPDAYLAEARSAEKPGTLWVKTANGWRLDTPDACKPAPQWERKPDGFQQVMRSDCDAQ